MESSAPLSFYLFPLLVGLFYLAITALFAWLLWKIAVEINRVGSQLGKLNLPAAAPPKVTQPAPNFESLRLQACERYTLLLERIAIPNLLLRTPAGVETSAREFSARLLLTIREEFEYNVSQQIYVSDSLWNIITQARDHIGGLIGQAAEGAETARQVADRLRLMSSRQIDNPVAIAQAAVRREAASVLTEDRQN